jgi:hypothetical protein
MRRTSLLHLSLLSLAMTYPAMALGHSQSGASTAVGRPCYFQIRRTVPMKTSDLIGALGCAQAVV